MHGQSTGGVTCISLEVLVSYKQESKYIYPHTYFHFQVPELDLFAIQMLNAAGDLLDLENAINPKSRPDWSKMTVEDLKSYIRTHGHCSAIVKVRDTFNTEQFQ